VTFTATVSPQVGGPVTGTVAFKQGNTILGTQPVVSGRAVLSLTTLGTGPHVVTALYDGDANVNASTSSSVTQTVVAPSAPTTTSLTSSLNPSIIGQMVTFTATVTSAVPGTPSGMVTFRRGQVVLGTGSMSAGRATYSTTALPAGSSGITAVYSGDSKFITSTSASLTQQVNKGVTTTVLTISPSPSTVGQLVTFTATVTSSTGVIPTGAVTFKEGSTTLGVRTLNASGVTTFTTSALAKGKHNGIKAQYEGDANSGNSTSATLSHTVQ
jgi:hypothetical protein